MNLCKTEIVFSNCSPNPGCCFPDLAFLSEVDKDLTVCPQLPAKNEGKWLQRRSSFQTWTEQSGNFDM